MTASEPFDRLTLDEAHLLQGLMAAGWRRVWADTLSGPQSAALDGLRARGLVRAHRRDGDAADQLEVTPDGFALLADTPWWEAPWFVPDSPGWLTDAWYAWRVLGLRIVVTPYENGKTDRHDVPFTAAAVQPRTGSDWPMFVPLLGLTADRSGPSRFWDAAVERADDLIAVHGLDVSFCRLVRADGRRGWGCRIASGEQRVSALGDRLVGPFADRDFQGTTLTHAAWLALRDGLIRLCRQGKCAQ